MVPMSMCSKNLRILMAGIAYWCCLQFVGPSASGQQPISNTRPNVLFIAVDDLRPQLQCFGVSKVKSPNIDRLAASGTVFSNAYCNVPVCGASRASLLSGLRPTRQRFLSYKSRMDADCPKVQSIWGHFKNAGYHSIGLGKLSHFPDDFADQWSKGPWRPDYPEIDGPQKNWTDYQLSENQKMAAARRDLGPVTERADVNDDQYYDGQIASRAVSDLQRLANQKRPFFLGVGFLKPHLPFNAPEKYWQLYDDVDFEVPDNYFPPENAPQLAMHRFGELRGYLNVPKQGPVSDAMAVDLIRGYHACVSFVDAQIGRVLDALDQLGLSDQTIVVLWGDHGWNLGEHRLWCKHCNFRNALQVPLVVRVPKLGSGNRVEGLVELVDLYPTLCELSGVNPPSYLQGTSFAKAFNQSRFLGKPAVFSRWYSGLTITTPTHALTQWVDRQGEETGMMLFNHTVDPDENRNVAQVASESENLRRLKAQLKQFSANENEFPDYR